MGPPKMQAIDFENFLNVLVSLHTLLPYFGEAQAKTEAVHIFSKDSKIAKLDWSRIGTEWQLVSPTHILMETYELCWHFRVEQLHPVYFRGWHVSEGLIFWYHCKLLHFLTRNSFMLTCIYSRAFFHILLSLNVNAHYPN